MVSFKSNIFMENDRYYIPIPFNVWETLNIKGNIPVHVKVNDLSFECKLIPKGKGFYLIPIIKSLANQILDHKNCEVELEVIEQLSRINKNSPYDIKKPIRNIDSITLVLQPDEGLCGQACVAMLTGLSINEVIQVMNCRKWQASLSKVIETLDYYGIQHASKFTYTKGKQADLGTCSLISAKGTPKNHLLIYFKGQFYDPVYGVLDDYDMTKIIGILKIVVLEN